MAATVPSLGVEALGSSRRNTATAITKAASSPTTASATCTR